DPGMNLRILTLDSYQPAITTVGTQYQGSRWRFGGAVEYQACSKLGKEIKKDTIAGPAAEADGERPALQFLDIVVPRLAGEYNITEHIAITGGVAYSRTTIKSRGALDMNLLDGDKVIVGLGV